MEHLVIATIGAATGADDLQRDLKRKLEKKQRTEREEYTVVV